MKTIKKGALILYVFLFHILSVMAADVYNGGTTSEIVGKVVPFAGQTIPTNYIEAKGQTLQKSQYPELFSVMGYTYGGSGDSFKIPDLSGRLIAGLQRNVNEDTYSHFSSVGKTGGEKSVTITTDTLAKHTHTFVVNSHTHTFTGEAVTTSSSGSHSHEASGILKMTDDHTHSYSGTTSTNGNHAHNIGLQNNACCGGAGAGYGLGYGYGSFEDRVIVTGIRTSTSADGAHTHTMSGTTSSTGEHNHTLTGNTEISVSHTHTVTPTGTVSQTSVGGENSSVGGGAAHNNLQPYIVLKYIIKYR